MSLNRRELGRMAAASLVASALPQNARAASAVPALPAGAVDCHNHIMGPRDKYPYAEDRVYTPPEATVADLKALRARIGTARNVLVTPSVYGIDNRCLVDALAELAGSARGIAVLPVDVSDAELRRLDTAGVRGVRLAIGGTGRYTAQTTPPAIASLSPRFFKLGWNIEIVGPVDVIAGMAPAIAESRVPVVLDHFAGANGDGSNQKGFAAILDLVRARNTFVKLSAPYNRSSKPDYSDMLPLARALIEAGPDRMLWGTNWPHPDQIAGRPISEITPYHVIDNENLVRLFAEWCPDAGTRKTIAVDTPARLYRFA
ncbi:MAG TPA: amidohydrolase family protein [Micropepsaceae bacterium]|nr:amidohydrolase family protein [Micropepsaceae bacterium]